MHWNVIPCKGIVVVGLYNKQIVCVWLERLSGFVCVKAHAGYKIPFQGDCFIASTIVSIVKLFISEYKINHPLLAFVIASDFMLVQKCVTFTTATPSDQQIKELIPMPSFWGVEYVYPLQEEHAFYVHALSCHIMYLCRLVAAQLKLPLLTVLPEWSALLHACTAGRRATHHMRHFFQTVAGNEAEIQQFLDNTVNDYIRVIGADCMIEKNKQWYALCGVGLLE